MTLSFDLHFDLFYLTSFENNDTKSLICVSYHTLLIPNTNFGKFQSTIEIIEMCFWVASKTSFFHFAEGFSQSKCGLKFINHTPSCLFMFLEKEQIETIPDSRN